ncbi:MAG: host attachment protein [Bdellovibrio sp.]|nr:MAG: host attachment protein [Bdellovibrio sp.]
MKNHWLLAANGSQAIIYKHADPHREPVELYTFQNEEARQHEHDITTDIPGRSFDSTSPHRHALTKEHSPKEQSIENFATQIANFLEEKRKQAEVEWIILSGEPKFLGILNKKLSAPTKNIVIAEVDKDLVHLKPEKIKQVIFEKEGVEVPLQ